MGTYGGWGLGQNTDLALSQIWSQLGKVIDDADSVKIEHNDLIAMQGGQALPSERYHMTLAQYEAATRDATNSVNGLMPAGKMDAWDEASSILLDDQAKNTVLAGPVIDPDAAPTFRALVADDIPDLSATYDPAGTAASAIGAHELTYDHTLIATALQAETDPIFTAWDKSTGISITESQISDLQAYLTAETDTLEDVTGRGASTPTQVLLYGNAVLGENKGAGTPNNPGLLGLWSDGDNAYYTTIMTGEQTENCPYTLPTALPAASDYLLKCSDGGVFGWQDPANWNTAYGWGNHASAGYLTAAPKLDDCAAPDDNTDLDASTSAHGLAPKAVAPAAGVINYLGLENGETAYKMVPGQDIAKTADPIFNSVNVYDNSAVAEGIKLQTWYNSSVPHNACGRLFFAETDDNTYGFSWLYAGTANPPMGGVTFSVLENYIYLLRHNNSTAGNAVLLASRVTGYVGIGISAAPHSQFQIGGSFATVTTATSTDLTLTAAHSAIEATGGAGGITITLPTNAAGAINGREYTITKVDAGAGAITIDGNAVETINGATTQSLAAQWDSITIKAMAAGEWMII